MQIKVGIDITRRNKFLKSYQTGGLNFIERIFLPQEVRQNTPEQLSGIFAIKEAVMKALELPTDSWLKISTNRQSNGKVKCSITDHSWAEKIASLDTSISHDGEWIIAVAVASLA